MAKLIKFSGYYLDKSIPYFNEKKITNYFIGGVDAYVGESIVHQLHVDISDEFEIDGEDKENCDLALLERHFSVENDNNVDFDRPLPKKGEKYKHFKLGNVVEIIGISEHTETHEKTVVYLYDDKMWARPLLMFMSEVDHDKYPDAKQKYRFELVEE